MKTPSIAKVGLVEAMDQIGTTFALDFVKSMDARLEPYMPYYEAMEVIDPTAANIHIKDAGWVAVEDLCKRYDLPFRELKLQIVEMRENVDDELSAKDIQLCKENLLCFYHQQVKGNSSRWAPCR